MGAKNCNCCKRQPNEDETEFRNNGIENPPNGAEIGSSKEMDKKVCRENLGTGNNDSTANFHTQDFDLTKSHVYSVNATDPNQGTIDNNSVSDPFGNRTTTGPVEKPVERNSGNTSPNKLSIGYVNDKSKISSKKMPLEIVNESNQEEGRECDLEEIESSEYMKVKMYKDLKKKEEEIDLSKDENRENSNLKKSKIEASITNRIEEESREVDDSQNQNLGRYQARRTTTRKRSTIKDAYVTKLVKKEINREDPLEQWRKLNIKDIIGDAKLNSNNQDEIMFQGDVFKYIATKNAKEVAFNKLYNTKFLVFTKTELRYYKNTESFLMMQPPIQKIPTFHITQISRITVNTAVKGKKMHHFAIKLLSPDPTKSNIRDLDISNSNNGGSRIPGSKKNLEEICTEIMEHSIHEEGGNKFDLGVGQAKRREKERDKNGKLKSQKMLPIESLDNSREEKNQNNNYRQYMNNQQEQETAINVFENNVLVFAAEKEDLINKWTFVLDYFSSKL